MTILDIKTNILLSHQEIIKDQNHRYRSWEYCFDSFNNLLAGNCDVDYAALNLAFYLASWGMYRGSSQLLQKDYRVHLPILELLLKPSYRLFHNFDVQQYIEDSEKVDTLFALVKEIRTVYCDSGISPTDTLVTKVLLGTFCCVPAYDFLFKCGISIWNSKKDLPIDQRIVQQFGIKSIRDLTSFYLAHVSEFNSVLGVIASRGVIYPPMKLVDMYFLNLGVSKSP